MTEHSVEGNEKALYKLALRNATFADAMAVFGSQLIPWHAYMAFFKLISKVFNSSASSILSSIVSPMPMIPPLHISRPASFAASNVRILSS